MPNGKPTCFVAMPFGKPNTALRHHYDKVYEHIIKIPVEDAGFHCDRADKIPGTEDAGEAMKNNLLEAALVVVDLSDRNPNVFYELGYRHALKKPTITIASTEEMENIGLPFNIRQYKTIPYDMSDIASIDTCRETIRRLAETYRSLSRDGIGGPPPDLPEPTLADLEHKLEIGLANIHNTLAELAPTRSSEIERMLRQVVASVDAYAGQADGIKDLKTELSRLVRSSTLVRQTEDLGVVSIHPNRLEAIEREFFRKMQDEEEGIDIVGSTIFGLKGRAVATNEKILRLFHDKGTRPDFQLRILLTHWDHVSGRQAQEKTTKNIARYVISKELLDAVKTLRHQGISEFVKFYRGAPTCFTIICRGQKQMLLNPYPYEREAFNSWSIVFRETDGGVYDEFARAHFEQPWDNKDLTVPFSDECLPELEKRYREDLARAREDIDREIENHP